MYVCMYLRTVCVYIVHGMYYNTHVHVCVYIVHVYVHNVYVCITVCMYVLMYCNTCVYVHVHVYVCMYIYVNSLKLGEVLLLHVILYYSNQRGKRRPFLFTILSS